MPKALIVAFFEMLGSGVFVIVFVRKTVADGIELGVIDGASVSVDIFVGVLSIKAVGVFSRVGAISTACVPVQDANNIPQNITANILIERFFIRFSIPHTLFRQPVFQLNIVGVAEGNVFMPGMILLHAFCFHPCGDQFGSQQFQRFFIGGGKG